MTKTEILATLNTFISAVGLVTKTRHTDANETIVDEIYPTEVDDNNITEIYTTKAGTTITYKVKIIKSGNIAHISGQVTNGSGLFQGAQSIFAWKENQYKMKSDPTLKVLFLARNATNSVRLLLDEDGLSINTGEFMGEATFTFDFLTYITQD